MKKLAIALIPLIIIGSSLILFSIPSWAYYPKEEPGAKEQLTPTRMIVKLRADSDVILSRKKTGIMCLGLAAYDSLNNRYRVARQEYLYPAALNHTRPDILKNVFVLEVPHGADIFQMIEDYKKLDVVEYAEPDWPVELLVAPNDSLYPHQWALNNTGQGYYHVLRRDGSFNDTLVIEYGVEDADIDGQEVFDDPPDNTTTVIVAISDTGVDMDHPDLAEHIWINQGEIPDNGLDDDHNGYIDDIHGWDFAGDSLFGTTEDNDPTDQMGHGTHCAGIVAAVADNSLGVAGVVEDCKIMPLSFYPKNFLSLAARSIVYAADNGADIISMSWGTFIPMSAVGDAVEYAFSKGVVLCAAAGNDGIEFHNYPATYPGVIAVGATNSLDEVTGFSTYGDHLSVCAPGQSILSLRADTTDMYAAGGKPSVHIIDSIYYLASGTSMACPYAAGVAAYMRAVSPGLRPDRVKEILELSSDDFLDPYGTGQDLPGWDMFSGHGRINLRNAVDAVPHLRAKIMSPRPNEIVSGIIDISGYADGVDFNGYAVEYGPGSSPSNWTEIETSSLPVTDGLLASLDSDGLNGTYTTRLRVGETNYSQVTVNIANMTAAAILSPSVNDTVSSLTVITGTAICPDFKSYILEYGTGISPIDWNEIAEITMPVVEAEMTKWFTGILAGGIYTLRLSVFSSTGLEAADSVNIVISSIVSPEGSWKVALNTPAGDPAIVANYGDFDNDGVNDIVVGTSEGLKFYNPDGTPKTDGIPDTLGSHSFWIPVAVGDLDGDGIEDLVAVDNAGNLFGFPSNEQSFVTHAELPDVSGLHSGSEWILPYAALKDIDADNRDEIHYFTGYKNWEEGYYHIYNPDGSLRLEVPRIAGYRRYDYLGADIDGDGVDELYMANDVLFLADINGEILDSFDLQMSPPDSVCARSMSAVDIDGDNKLELIVLAENIIPQGGFVSLGTYLVYAFDENLSLKPGWPHDTEIPLFLVPSDVVFGDIDNDDIPEYFMTVWDMEFGYACAWTIDGTPYADPLGSPLLAITPNPAILKSPVLGDGDGDGFPDIIASAASDVWFMFEYERLMAWNRHGELLSGWPLFIETEPGDSGNHVWRNTVAIADVDKDGRTDLLATTYSANNLVFINLEDSPYAPSAVPVPFWRYNRSLNNVAPISVDFEVIAVSPTKRQLDVPVNTSIMVSFNRDVDEATINDTTFLVRGNRSGFCQGEISYDNATRTTIFQPSSDFEPNELVTIELTTDVHSSEGYSFKRSFISVFGVLPSPPEVVCTSPLQDEIDVLQDVNISVTFSTDMNTYTINDSAFLVTGSYTGTHPGIITYDSLTRTAVLDPLTDFAPGEVITVELTTNIQSTLGLFLDEGYTWSFSIAGILPEDPEIVATSPLHMQSDVPVNTSITATFNTHMDGATINDSTFLVTGSYTGIHQGPIMYDSLTKTAIFSPLDSFAHGELVTAELTSDIQSIFGRSLDENYIWSFSIGYRFNNMSISPLPNDVSVPINTNISVRFHEDMNEATINDSTFIVHSAFTGRQWGSITYDNVARKAVFEPIVNFFPAELVTAVLTDGVQTFDSLVPKGKFLWSFTTEAEAAGANFIADSSYSVDSAHYSMFAADLDSDSDIDLVAGNYWSGSFSILLNDGGGAFSIGAIYPLGQPSSPADIDNDHDVDLISLKTKGSTDSVCILLNNGVGLFDSLYVFPFGHGNRSIIAADIDADGDLDLMTESAEDDSFFVSLNNGDGTFNPCLGSIINFIPSSIVPGDVDRDGDLDLAASCAVNNSVFIVPNNGDGTFAFDADSNVYGVGSHPRDIIAADLNDDGFLDLATADWQSSYISVLLNKRDASFYPRVACQSDPRPYSIFAADYDGDGDVDLSATGRNSNVCIVLNNGDGTFTPHAKYPVGHGVYSHTAADLDGDGDLDIAVGGYRHISILLNEEGATSIDEVQLAGLPDLFYLRQNYPNPLNQSTVIDFALPKGCDVTLDIYNILGRKVNSLVNEPLRAGYHSISWDGTNSKGQGVASGIYFYRIRAGEFVETKKMVLLK